MAEGTITRTQEQLDVISSAITFNASGAASGSNGTVKKWGRVVTITGVCIPTTSGTSLFLASVPSAYAPSEQTWLSTDYYAPTFSGEVDARVNTSGAIVFSVGSDTKDKNIKFCGSWIV